MGVRSDVYFLCQEPVYKAFKAEVLDKWPAMRPDSVKILKSTYPHLPDCYLLTWKFIKWYDDFVDVHEANKFIESRANGEDYHLVNVGEGFKFIIITESEDSKSITAYAEGLPDCEFYTEMKIHLPEGRWQEAEVCMDEQELRAIAIKQYEELGSAGAQPWQMFVVGATLISVTIARVTCSGAASYESSTRIQELISEIIKKYKSEE